MIRLSPKYPIPTFVFCLISGLLLIGCQSRTAPPTMPPPVLTDTPSPTVSATSLPATQIPTLVPKATATSAPRLLTVCMGAEPDTLYLYGSNMLAAANILEAVYDGPINSLGFEYQPVILAKLPSLADGDARIEPLTVQMGDRVVNDAGEIVSLSIGERVRPFGCNHTGCAITWEGAPLQMAQLSADFRLLEGIQWSDGEPLTATDSLFSYEVALQCRETWSGQEQPCGSLGEGRLYTLQRTAAYSALDDLSVRWSGLPGFLDPTYSTNFAHPLPRHQLLRFSPDELMDAEESAYKPMGWGPYIIEKWEPGQSIRLRKNPHYFRADEGLPRFDRLIFRFTGENSEANIADLLAGKCDLVERNAHLDDASARLIELDAQGQLQAHFAIGTVWEHADFSLQHISYDDGYQPGVDRPDLFGDVRTRRAIALCMDRQRIVDEVLFGQSLVLDSYIPPGHPLFDMGAAHYNFDVAAGSALLEEVGWVDHDGDPATPRRARRVPNVADETPLIFDYWTTTANQRQQASQILADSLAQCGIQLNLQSWKAEEFFAEGPDAPLFGRQFDMAAFAWLTGYLPPCELFTSENIPGDPAAVGADGSLRFPRGWQGTNDSGYSNPEFDDACRTARALLPGQPGYLESHLRAQQIFAADLPVVPLYMRIKVTAARADMCGYRIDPTANSDTWGIEEYDFDEDCRR